MPRPSATYRLWIGAASVTGIFLASGGRLSVGG